MSFKLGMKNVTTQISYNSEFTKKSQFSNEIFKTVNENFHDFKLLGRGGRRPAASPSPSGEGTSPPFTRCAICRWAGCAARGRAKRAAGRDGAGCSRSQQSCRVNARWGLAGLAWARTPWSPRSAPPPASRRRRRRTLTRFRPLVARVRGPCHCLASRCSPESTSPRHTMPCRVFGQLSGLVWSSGGAGLGAEGRTTRRNLSLPIAITPVAGCAVLTLSPRGSAGRGPPRPQPCRGAASQSLADPGGAWPEGVWPGRARPRRGAGAGKRPHPSITYSAA